MTRARQLGDRLTKEISAEFEIAAGAYAARVATQGGVLLSLTKAGIDLLRPAPKAPSDPRDAACFACLPYFGRLPGGLRFGARRYPLRPTHPAADPVNALHGDAWMRRWTVAEAGPRDVFLSFVGRPEGEGPYPFRFTATQRFSIGEAGLSITVCLRNDEDFDAPLGVALHPAFRREAATAVAFEASGLWTFDAVAGGGTQTPLLPPRRYDRARALPRETVDHAFTGFGGAASVAGFGTTVRLSTDASILHVFAPAGENYFCLEPATHRPCRFGDDEGVAAGGERRLFMHLGG